MKNQEESERALREMVTTLLPEFAEGVPSSAAVREVMVANSAAIYAKRAEAEDLALKLKDVREEQGTLRARSVALRAVYAAAAAKEQAPAPEPAPEG